MALRGLFRGFPGIKEPPSAEPCLPPISLSPDERPFLKPNRTRYIYREKLETRRGDDKPIIASRRRRGSWNAFNLRRRTTIVCDRTNGKTAQAVVRPSFPFWPRANSEPPRPPKDTRTSIEPSDTVINVRVAVASFPRNFASTP